MVFTRRSAVRMKNRPSMPAAIAPIRVMPMMNTNSPMPGILNGIRVSGL